MKSYRSFLGIAAVSLCVPASSQTNLSAAQLSQAWKDIDARKAKVIDAAFRNPYPALAIGSGGPGGNAIYSLAALMKGQDTARANQFLIDLNARFPVPLDPIDFPMYFQMPAVARILYLFSGKSAPYPGRLTPAAEAALKNMLWCWIQKRSRVEDAARAKDNSVYIQGSGNHDIIRGVLNLLSAQALSDDPAYHGRALADGHTLEEHEAAWTDDYLNRYLAIMGGKGPLVEFASPTYFKYYVESLFNLRDFARSPGIRQEAESLLNVIFADMTLDLVDGIRGGAKVRCYRDQHSVEPQADSHNYYAWLMYGTRADLFDISTFHPNYIGPATSTYKVPLLYMDLALNTEARGSYAYVSAPPGLGAALPETSAFNDAIYEFAFPSSLRRYSYVTPEYVLGAFTVDRNQTYTSINSQNRWMGVNFKAPLHGNLDSRIFPTCIGSSHDGVSAYDDMNGVANGSAMLVQRLPEALNAGPMRIYFSQDLYTARHEDAGWVFDSIPGGGAYAAVKPSRGAFAGWQSPGTDPIDRGMFLPTTEQNIPIVFQCGLAKVYPTFASFIAAVKATGFAWKDTNTFEYTGLPGVGTITWHLDKSLPAVNGVAVDLSPRLFDSPYLQSGYGSGRVLVRNTLNDSLLIDFNGIGDAIKGLSGRNSAAMARGSRPRAFLAAGKDGALAVGYDCAAALRGRLSLFSTTGQLAASEPVTGTGTLEYRNIRLQGGYYRMQTGSGSFSGKLGAE